MNVKNKQSSRRFCGYSRKPTFTAVHADSIFWRENPNTVLEARPAFEGSTHEIFICLSASEPIILQKLNRQRDQHFEDISSSSINLGFSRDQFDIRYFRIFKWSPLFFYQMWRSMLLLSNHSPLFFENLSKFRNESHHRDGRARTTWYINEVFVEGVDNKKWRSNGLRGVILLIASMRLRCGSKKRGFFEDRWVCTHMNFYGTLTLLKHEKISPCTKREKISNYKHKLQTCTKRRGKWRKKPTQRGMLMSLRQKYIGIRAFVSGLVSPRPIYWTFLRAGFCQKEKSRHNDIVMLKMNVNVHATTSESQ